MFQEFLPGTEQEFGGIIRHGAKLLVRLRGSDRPKITVITRKAYRRRVLRDGSKHFADGLNFAYRPPRSRVMGAEGR